MSRSRSPRSRPRGPAKPTSAVHGARPSPNGSRRAERTISGFAVVPLRLFLGITFIYAAIQKLMDPGFFHAGSPTYIGAQILAFSRGSPIQGLLHHLMEFAVPVGLLTLLTESSIGLLVLLGLMTRPAALIGMSLSMGFFLSASWQTYPYFFGSDIVFVVCWLTIAITGPGVFALDAIIEVPLIRLLEARKPGRVQRLLFFRVTGLHEPIPTTRDADDPYDTDGVPWTTPQPNRPVLTRGEALVGSLVTLALVGLGLHPRARRGVAATGKLASGQGKSQATAGTAPTPGASAPGKSSAIPAGAKKIGNISQLPANSGGTVTDPKTGDPAVIVHTSGSNFYAFDAVCTHAGCTVQYDSQQRLLVCPCHGGTFDPAHGAQVVGGPPPSPLTPIDLKIDPHGDIYIV
jgi:thiosulfate dehydrogenase [quinone] large subunit